MSEEVKFTAGSPSDFTFEELDAFAELVRVGGEIAFNPRMCLAT